MKKKSKRHNTCRACCHLVEAAINITLKKCRLLIGFSKEHNKIQEEIMKELGSLSFALGWYDGYIDDKLNKKKTRKK